jgi:hypothetical protein
MRELVGLGALFGALIGIFLIWGSGNRSGLLGLLLTGAGLFLQYRWLSDSARETYQQIYQLEEQVKASQNKPMAEPGAAADQALRQTGHATNGSSWFSAFTRLSRLLSWVVWLRDLLLLFGLHNRSSRVGIWTDGRRSVGSTPRRLAAAAFSLC